MKAQNIGKLKLVKNRGFLRAIRASHCHPHSMAKDQQHRGKPQPVCLTSCVTVSARLFPSKEESLYWSGESWERVSENTQHRGCQLAQKGRHDGLASWKHNFCFLYSNGIVNTGLFQKGFLLHCSSLLVIYLFSLRTVLSSSTVRRVTWW